MEHHQVYELLKRYAQGQMPESERADFEKRIETDPAFAEEITTWAAIYKGIQSEGDRQLDTALRVVGKKLMQSESAELSATVMNSPQSRAFQMPRWAYAAAAALLLLVVAWPIYQNLQPATPAYADNKTLFEQHFRVPPAPEVRDAQVAAWRDAYQKKDYPAAAAELEKLLADPHYTRRSEAHLFLGLSHLAAGQGQKALAAFQKVNSDSFDWDDAQWYSALAYIIIDDVVHAKQTLGDIAGKNGHPHQREAQEMLSAMK
jgi:tetratricopeptide (TPR) repeat protein